MGAGLGGGPRSNVWMVGGGSSKGARGTDVASICLCPETGQPMRLPTHGAGFVGQLDQRKARINRSGTRVIL